MIELDLFDAHPVIGESEEKIELDVVLSVFDGMSCGQLALKQAGMTPRVYYASEIEQSPMDITKKNFPSTIMLGDVTKVVADDLPHVNLLLGGSPCQGFSFAGKQLNFNDPRSSLFFEFVRLLNECKPDFFLLENVAMQQEFQDIISAHVSGKLEPGEKGIQPQLVNSADYSAQNRKRLYWWGKRVGDKYIQLPIPDIEDMGIVLKDILEDIPIEKKLAAYMTGAYDGASRLEKGVFNFTDQDKAKCLTAKTGHGNKYLIHRPCEIRQEPRLTVNELQWDIHEYDIQDQRLNEEEGLELKDFTEETKCHHVATALDVTGHDMNKRVYANTGKAPTLHTRAGETKVLADEDYFGHLTYRKLTVKECARLQTVPDSYMEDCFDEKGKPVSDTQKFKALGNGWTVAVIVKILQGMRYIVKD